MASTSCKALLNLRRLRPWKAYTGVTRTNKLSTTVEDTPSLRKDTTTAHEDEIIIPPYVERSPTDILKALASTVGRDLTAAHYKFHDDPYLLPCSNLDKRMFSLSQESGRNAARWVRDTQAHLFQHTVAQPFSQSFAPVPMYDENSDVDEVSLLQLIDQARVSDAITVYKKLASEDRELSRDTRQALLELLSYYNCEDAPDEEKLEERWFSTDRESGKPRKTWKDNGIAEDVFRSLEPLDARAYNTLIKGMCKFYQADRAMKMWAEMTNLGHATELETYESLINIASFVEQSSRKDWEHVEGMLRRLSAEGLRPRAHTLTAVLRALLATGNWPRASEMALASWREFRKQGIEPTLGSYSLLLSICYRGRGPHSPALLAQVLAELRGREFIIQHPLDTTFFATAMEMCNQRLQDRDLALMVDELLHTGSNYNLIGDQAKEASYYRHLMVLLFNTEPIEEFMDKYYSKIVPNIYIPEPGVMHGLLKTVSLNGAVELLPQLWADMQMFEHTRRAGLLEDVLQALSMNPTEDEQLRTKLADVGWSLFETVERQQARGTEPVRWTGSMLGDLMIVLAQAHRVKDCARILNKLYKEQTSIVGSPDVRAIETVFASALEHESTSVATLCVRYASEMGFGEAQGMCDILLTKADITEDDRNGLVSAGLHVPSS